jgi:hypothetical protein
MYRANYALLPILEHLGPAADSLDVEWADFTGDHSSTQGFTVPVAEPVDAYLELQAFDVGEFGHEIVLDGEPLSGFDLPPADGWQYWMDSLAGRDLSGTNTLRIRRDTSGDDAFAVGNVVVNWREPLD